MWVLQNICINRSVTNTIENVLHYLFSYLCFSLQQLSQSKHFPLRYVMSIYKGPNNGTPLKKKFSVITPS